MKFAGTISEEDAPGVWQKQKAGMMKRPASEITRVTQSIRIVLASRNGGPT
jgi:hypothetical protein